jgi:large subunit ribosomal protein L6
MSKLTNRIIIVPPQVKVIVEKEKILARGPQGENELTINPVVEVQQEAKQILVRGENLVLVGTYNSLIYNLLHGVSQGYQKILEVKGVGYKVVLEGQKLKFSLGKSHSDYVDIPPDLKVVLEGNKIIISGVDKQKVHKFAANDIKILRPPSIYKKNKGIYYLDEEKDLKLRPGKTLRKS